MRNANDFRRGQVLRLDNKLYMVSEHQHTKPGKGGAFVKMRLKQLDKEVQVEKTFRPDEKVEDVYISRRNYQYLYKSGDSYIFMDLETYEQEGVGSEVLGLGVSFLKEGLEVECEILEGQILGVIFPMFVYMEVKKTEVALRGDTVGGATKPAELETGYRLRVPLFINEGDILKIDTRSGEYVSREKGE